MFKPSAILLAAGLSILAASCNNETATTEQKTDSTAVTANTGTSAASITLADVPASPDFPGAQLTMATPVATASGTDSAKVSFAFNVKNYELKSQTGDAGGKLCNNSDKGQHIHFILDNMPYVALYEPKHEATLAKNSTHSLICFLSRSYHESIKSDGAAVVYNFKIDEAGKMVAAPNPAGPQLFYSRPKGDYLGKDTANVLLDFYLANAKLGDDLMVKADILNETTGATASFDLKEWKPKFIQNLGTGKCMVTLSLVNKDGKTAEGPNTTISRKFNLAASEPIK